MSEEANFHLKGFVNKQNFRYSSDANLRCLWEEDPNYSEKDLFWCAVRSHCIVGPYLFQDANGHTVNIKCYTAILRDFLIPALNKDHPKHGYFWQNGATAFTAELSVDGLRENLPYCFLCWVFYWSSRPPELTGPFFIWEYLRERVYSNSIENREDL